MKKNNSIIKISSEKKSSVYILVLLLCLSFTNLSYAWNAAGHQLMAAITWDLLSVEQQDYWVDILEHHPRFKKDFKDHTTKYVKRNPDTYKEWVFRRASTWPDIARGIPAKQRDKYHHGSWHYINFPIYLDKKVDTKFVNRKTKWHGVFNNDLNIIQALKGNIEVLSKQGASKKEKAVALSWVLHLTGDSHQPLHSTALFSKNYFEKGDRGGNLIQISGQGQVTNLHWFWDSRLDNTTSFRIIDLKAKKLNGKNHANALKNQNKSIKSWLKDSNKLAKKHVYTPALLSILKNNEKNSKNQPTIEISNNYNIQARDVSNALIVDAAYKMASLLKNI
jgi:hypothetical protein